MPDSQQCPQNFNLIKNLVDYSAFLDWKVFNSDKDLRKSIEEKFNFFFIRQNVQG